MAVLDDIAALKPAYQTFKAWAAAHPDEAPGVIDAMRDDAIQIDPLLRTLRKHGIPCTRETVKAYRDGTR